MMIKDNVVYQNGQNINKDKIKKYLVLMNKSILVLMNKEIFGFNE